MNLRRIIEKRLRAAGHGVDVVSDVNAVVAANVGSDGDETSVSSRQRVVHRSRGTARAGRRDEEGAGSSVRPDEGRGDPHE